MPVRIVQGKLPYTGGTGIEIDTDKVISLLLREENNLIMVNDDNEVYTDLQLESGLTPSSDFPVGVTVGKVLQSDGWTQSGLILNWKTTSGDYARWIYANDGKLYFDNGTGTWKQVYYSTEVDTLIQALRDEVYEYFMRWDAFSWYEASGDTVELSLRTTITPTEDFVVNAPTTVKHGQEYILRVTSGATTYTMTLGAGITNPKNVDLTLNTNGIDIFVFLALDDGTLELQEQGGGGGGGTVNNGILTIKKNGTTVQTFSANQSTNVTANITVPSVVDNLSSISTTDALSANQGKELKDMIDDLAGFGKFLSLWNASTGQPISFPLATPYAYSTGDYFVVEVVSSATPPVNYKPNGSSYTGTASSTPETDELEIGDVYVYDGSVWLLQSNHGKTVSFGNIAGDPYDNTNLGNALNAKQNVLTAGNGIDITSNTISTTYCYGESSTAAATVQKEVSIPSITSLDVGQVIIVKPTVTSSVAASTLKLNNFPAYKMLYNAAEITTSTDSIVWAANIPSMFYLDEVSGTKYWRFLGHGLDSNTTYTINYLNDAGKYEAGSGTYAITRYALCMMKADGTWEKITDPTANYSTGTTKTVNTHGFVLNQIKYYNTTTTIAGGGFAGTNTLASQAASVRADYSFNCGTAPGWSVGDPIYIVGTIGNDGLFYLDTTARWTTTLPSTNNGKLYIRIGVALTTTDATISFLVDRPILYYDNGIKEYSSSKANVVDVNTKTFTLSSTSDTTTAQAAYDWYAAGKNPIVILSGVAYNIIGADSSAITFEGAKSQYPTVGTSYSAYKVDRLAFALSSGTVTNISSSTTTLSTYLETSEDYTTAYTPTYDGSPATKKYVDDNAGIQNDTTGTTTTVTAIWAGTEAEYALITPTSGVEYHVYPN